MYNTLTIIKYDLLAIINKFNKNKKSLLFTLVIAFLCILVFGFQFLITSIISLDSLIDSGFEYSIFISPLLVWLSSSLLFIVTNSVLLTEKNTEFLLSLPIKKSNIISSKSFLHISFYILIGLIVLIPTSILYIVKVDNNYLYLINSLLIIFFLSLGITGIGYLFNTFINFFVVKLKFYKLVRMLLVLGSVFIFLGVYLYITLSTNILNIIIIKDLVDYIINDNFVTFLIFSATSIILLILGTFTFSKLYGIKPKTFKSDNNKLNYNSDNILLSLIKKEFNNYKNSTMYLFNTVIGYIMILGGAIFLVFFNKEVYNLDVMIYLFLSFCLSITCTTNSSISLEGKNIWIIKTAPIKTITILLSKVLMNLIMLSSVLTISFFILIISNKIQISTLLLLYLLSILIAIFISFSGIIVNLLLPKLEFKNEMEVVKQSAAAISSILFFICFLSTPSLLYMLNLITCNLNTLIIINILYLILLNTFIVFIFFKKGPKLFKKL